MKTRSLSFVQLAGIIGIAIGGAIPAYAINCGEVLGPGGKFKLDADLDCPPLPLGPNPIAFTVQDGASLDLKGHTVTCGGLGVCVKLTGTGAELKNGVVQGAFPDTLNLEGSNHTVKDVRSVGPVEVLGDNHQLINVTAESADVAAIGITGNNNRLIRSTVLCGPLKDPGCIEVFGDNNDLRKNFNFATAQGAVLTEAGFFIEGNNNQLRQNEATFYRDGIVVDGTNNNIEHNTAVENFLDLKDASGDCAHNTWKHNTFVTSDPSCIE
jgi:hypothetical protein